MIFPDWGTAPETNESPLPLFREWAVDWESGALALRGGEPYTLEGDEAVKLWVRLALDARCARWRYSAHSGDYGNELAALLGRSGDAGIRESLLKRTITETLLVCPYITGMAALREAIARQKGAHLTVTAVPCAALTLDRAEALHGGALELAWGEIAEG